ncbi:MAG TPA: IS256 family transposase [Bryobacteraceae bacterium]
MKARYQKEAVQAAEKYQAWAQQSKESIQLKFPAPEMIELMKQGLGELVRQLGKMFIEEVLESEAEQLAGPRSKPAAKRHAYRWGQEQGYCVIDGQKVPIARPRVRSKVHNREIPLGSYELFQRASLLEESVWHKIMHGLSTRNYKEVLQQFSDAYGVEKSTVSEHFVEASRKKLEIVMTRSLAELSIDVMMIDGTIFKGFHLVVAIGIDRFGHKIVLGLRQGATENAAVVGELLSELAERGLTFSQPRLYVVDGGKAIRRAILNHAGDAAFIQRCQVHKIRNVCEHIPDAQQSAVKYKMRCAYEMSEAADAQQALWKLHDELLAANPSAAASLMEGMEETLTVLELRVGHKLRRSIASTNGIESSFSVTERICRQVKRWQGSDHRLRWVASTLLFAESRWHRLIGYPQIEALVSSMKAEYALRLQKQKAALRPQVSAA